MPLEIPYDTIIIPLRKPKLPRDLASSYRPIALCSQIIKVCEKIIVNAIRNHLININMIDKNQYAFITKKGSIEQLIRLLDKVVRQLEDGKTDVVYTDFRKAFDKVSHYLLL